MTSCHVVCDGMSRGVTSCHVVCDVMSRGVGRHVTWCVTSCHVMIYVISRGKNEHFKKSPAIPGGGLMRQRIVSLSRTRYCSRAVWFGYNLDLNFLVTFTFLLHGIAINFYS